MNLFGMGPMEVTVILVVALIIFGPGRLPEMGAQAGKAVRDFRKLTKEMTSEIEPSMGEMRAAMDEMRQTVTDVQRDTKQAFNTIPDTLNEATSGLAIPGVTRPGAAASAGSNAASPAVTPTRTVTVSPAATATAVAPAPVPAAPRPGAAPQAASRANPFADFET